MTEQRARAWVRGWAMSRGAQVGYNDGAWHVAVAAATRDEEYVLINPSADQLDRTRALISGPRSWLTILGTHVELGDALEAVSRVETLMDAPLTPGGPRPDVSVEVVDAVAHVRMMADDIIAARGQVAVCDGVAVLDRIETHPDFRRQGRGRIIVDALQSWAYEQGARHGVLLASPDGRALYTALGWRDTMPAATFAGR